MSPAGRGDAVGDEHSLHVTAEHFERALTPAKKPVLNPVLHVQESSGIASNVKSENRSDATEPAFSECQIGVTIGPQGFEP